MSYQQAYNQLQGLQPIFDNWAQIARQVDGGEDVVLNIESEPYLNSDLFSAFLTLIATNYQSNCENSNSNAEAAKQAYDDSCKELARTRNLKLYCQGIISELNNQTLCHRVLQLEKLKTMVCNAMSEPPEKKDECWQQLLKLQQEDQDGFLSIWQDIIPFRVNRIEWIYFNENQTNTDPLADQCEDNVIRQLGLNYEPGKDRNDDLGAWRIHYQLDENITTHIPTIADTFYNSPNPRISFWNPYFQVTDDERWGWTRPINKPRGTRGVPEVVYLIQEDSENEISISMINQIEFLGDYEKTCCELRHRNG